MRSGEKSDDARAIIEQFAPTTIMYTNFTGILDRVAASDGASAPASTTTAPSSLPLDVAAAAAVQQPPALSSCCSASLWSAVTELSQVTVDDSSSSSGGATASTHQSSDSRTDADWNADFESTLAANDAEAMNRFCSLVPFTTWCTLSDNWLRFACRAGATEAARVLRSRGAAWSPPPSEETAAAAAAAEEHQQEQEEEGDDLCGGGRRRRRSEEDTYEDDTNVTVVPSPVAHKKCRTTV